MASLGSPIVYTVAEKERAKSVREDKIQHGSLYHPEMTAFAGQVVRVLEEGRRFRADIVIFPPKRTPVFLENVSEGKGVGEFEALYG